jgi:hypothetical protein
MPGALRRDLAKISIRIRYTAKVCIVIVGRNAIVSTLYHFSQ